MNTNKKFDKFCIIFVITFLISVGYCGKSETVKGLVGEAEKVVSNALKSPDAGIRDNAIEVASQKNDFLPKIAELLKDDMISVRFTAAVAIGDSGYKGCEKQLQQLLKDPDLNVRIAAAYALCKLGEKQHLSIIEKAAEVNDQTVKANTAMLLGKLKSTESLAILYRLKDNPNSSYAVAFNATEAIARIGDEKIYQRIWAMLISVYVDDRCMGIQAMSALGGVKGTNAILAMLDDEVSQVRLAAAEQLGALGDTSGQFVVLEYLNSSQRQEKIMAERCNVLAALAIGQIGTEKLAEYLPKLLKNDSPAVQLAAAKSVFMLARHN